MKIVKKRVIIIFLTLLFTILAFGKVDLYAETTDEGPQLEKTTLSKPASETEETKEEPEEAPQEEIEEEVKETVEEVKETEQVEDTNETVEEERPQVEDKTKEKSEESVEGSEDQQTVSDAKEPVDQEDSKEEEIKEDDEKAEEKPETEVQEGGETEAEEKAENKGQEKSEEKSEEKVGDSEEAKEAEKTDEETEGETVLEEGEVLEISELAENPLALGAGQGEEAGEVRVATFDDLKKAIESTTSGEKKTIVVTETIVIEGKIQVPVGAEIILTSLTQKNADEKWKPIDQPKDFADKGEAKQREKIEEARDRGDKAIKVAENGISGDDEYTFTFGSDEIIFKRKSGLGGTLFEVLGNLTLGNDKSTANFDGNETVGTFFEVQNGGKLTLKNGTIANGKNTITGNAAVKIKEGGNFIMEGGRITANEIIEDTQYSLNAGGVYVSPGGKFTMNNGMIDHNIGAAGGVFAGDFRRTDAKEVLKKPEDAAIVEINGGYILSNKTRGPRKLAGGIAIYAAATLNLYDGIIAGNYSGDVGGGIGISSQYIYNYSQVYRDEWTTLTSTNYDEFIRKNKSEANINGGLIFKNRSAANGAGVYVDSNDVTFGTTMILENESYRHGGGIYISFPPITQKLEHILITENLAEGFADAYLGGSNGGGIWNCPTGYVHIGDRHSVYAYNNNAGSYGQDITFVKKAWNFKLNGKYVGSEFYSHISPVTEGKNIIKYVEDGRGREFGETIPGHLSYHNTYTYLKAIYSQALIEEAWKNSNTFVLGNKARNGGGVGSNANLITDDEGDYQIEFNKKWNDSVDQYHAPTTVWVDLFIVPLDKDADYVKANYGKDNKLFKYGEVLIREADKWHTRFGSNDYNGADKSRILQMLGINSFTDIGLPKDAFNMDKGLLFTADELAEKGYKYLAVEQGMGFYHVEITEEKPTEDKTVEAGVLEITRKYNGDYDDESVRGDKDLYFYLYDPDKQVLTRLGKSTIHEGETTPNVGKTTFAHPLLLKKVSEYKYYGEDRKFTEYLKYGWDDMVGYHNLDSGYAIVLTENADGTLTVEVPYLWTDDYYGDGFWAKQLEGTEDYEIKGNNAHSFTLTNSNWGQLDVEKSWTNIEEKDQPESMDFYLLLDGKRVIEGYDKDGKPIYKKLTLTAKGKWKGTFKKLDPKALAAGKYTLEENSDIFAPEFINKKEKFIIRIGYANEYREEGQAENEETSTSRHFLSENYKNEDGTYSDVKLNLYLDGKKVQEGVFHFTVGPHPITGKPWAQLEKNFAFKELEVETYGQDIPVKYYDVITNETGRDEYNFYIRKDENGAYALYLPRLVIKGVPYAELFIANSNEFNETYQRYEQTTYVTPLKADVDWQIKTENHYGPDHRIEFLKEWFGGANKIPEEITVIVTNEEGEVKEIKLTKEGNWQETIENLKGTLRKHGYTIKEVDVPGFNSDIKTEKAGLKVIGKDKEGKEITLNYMTDELKRILAEGNYRYEVFELSEEDKKKEFNQDNLSTFIKVERQKDGRYIIRYAKDVSLTEIFSVNIKNTEVPPEEPRKTYVRVNKVWEALGETQAIRVQLYVNGEATNKFLTLSEENGWTATFYDLDEYDFMGNRYTYTVREVGDENGLYKIGDREFEVSYAGNMDKGFTITNKEIPPEKPEEPEEPDEPEPEEPEEPDEPEDEGGGENIIPKTGVKTDAKSIYLSLILLIALVVLKRKKYSK